MRKHMVLSTVLVFACLVSPHAVAAYNYGTNVQGTSVTYLTIDTTTNIWGTMSINGDALRFKPTDFKLEKQDGASGVLSDTLQFTMQAKPGQAENRYITAISFIEYGNYGLIDNIGGLGTDLTNAAVTCDVEIDIQAIDGTPYFGSPIITQLTYTPSAGNYYLDTDGAILQKAWTGNLNAVLSDYGFSNVTKVGVSITNTLNVASENGTIARIEKKGLGENPAIIVTPEVPEPATMILLGLGSLFFLKKRSI